MSDIQRSKTQPRDNVIIDGHRLRISELLLQHYDKSEIIATIKEEFGYELTGAQLRLDIDAIQLGWIASANLNYDLMMNQELARLDALETELWKQLRKSAEPKVREVIDRLPRKIAEELTEEEVGYIIAKVQSTKESGAINPVYFSRIIDVQKERRKLLGMYAPKHTKVDLVHTVNVKGYNIVSPDDWDDAIEGKTIEKIESGNKEKDLHE